MGISEEKAKGRVYTPDFLVANILNLSGYTGEQILRKHVIDNSCGDGAFLAEIVKRYIFAAKKAGYSSERTAAELSEYVHGIEINPTERQKALQRVSREAASLGVKKVEWDIVQGDALQISRYDGKMNFVLGNPPYVRVHHLADSYSSVKRFSFARKGMTDLFIVFYEIGIKMLKEGGTLGYITPSSLYSSRAARELRAFLVRNRLLRKVVDLKHFQPFSVTTYTTIFILQKGALSSTQRNAVSYYEYDEASYQPKFSCRLNSGEFYRDENFYFGSKQALRKMQTILKFRSPSPGAVVKNGFATLCDKFFIGDRIFQEFTIPVVKASTGQRTRCLFPYDRNGQIVPYSKLTESASIKRYYEQNEEKLKSRSLRENDPWYGFGRTQGIQDVFKRKFSLCPIIRTPNDLKVTLCKKGVGVYGGLYILTNLRQEELESILMTGDFMEYVVLLGKYKSGGYYTFSSKDLERYLNYQLFQNGNGAM